jgi:hypothetical protein
MGERTWSNLRRAALVAAATLLALAAATAALGQDGEPEFTSEFHLEDCTWASSSEKNSLFPLRPGWQVILAGEEEGDEGIEEVEVQVTVLRERLRLTFNASNGKRVNVVTRVVEEREHVDGELVEVARNYFALCQETGDVFYFGETVDNYEDGEVANHNGSWRAGKGGATPGLFMPARFLLGSRYYQEQAPGVAIDRGENVDMELTVETEAGTFRHCVMVLDTNGLDPAAEGDEKVYCPGIGMARDEDLELVEYGFVH